MMKTAIATISNTLNKEGHTKTYSSVSQNEEEPKIINNCIPAIPNDFVESVSFSLSSHSSKKNNNKSNRNTMEKKDKEKTCDSDEEMVMKEEEECDNDYERNDCFIRLKLEEWNTSYYTLVTISSALMYHDRTKIPDQDGIVSTNKDLYNASINLALIFTSISVVLFILASINRYLILLKLHKSTLKIPRKTTFFNIYYFPSFLLESIVALFHPNIFTKGLKFMTSKSWFLVEVEYEINDFLVLIVMFRVYVVFRLVFSITIYYSSRSERMAQLIGTKLTRVFAMKCLIVVHPFYLLGIVGVFMVTLLSFMLKVLEGQTYIIGKSTQDFRQIQNCLWNVLVTMTTVGYGDYFPITNFGRIVNVLTSIGGSCLISLLTLSLQNALTFTEYEAKAFRNREKELMREDIEKAAGKYFKASFKYLLARKMFREVRAKNIIDKKERMMTKKKMEQALYEKIETKRGFKDTIQLFRNIYEIPTESDVLKSKMDEFQEELTILNNETGELSRLLEDINQILKTESDEVKNVSHVSSSAIINFSST